MEGLSHVYEDGDGRTLVFIHGWLGSKEFWRLITPHIGADNPRLFYDQRCHGESENKDFDLEDLARDLHDLLQEQEIKDPVLVGHSMGGMTALKYSTMYENFSGLFLLGTTASTPEPENRSVRHFLDKFKDMDREEWAGKIADNYIQGKNDKIREMTKKELMEADERPVVQGLKAMEKYDVRNELEESSAVVVAGEKDGAVTLEKSQELVNLLDCRLEVLDVTHQMLPERPEKIGELVTEFVENEL